MDLRTCVFGLVIAAACRGELAEVPVRPVTPAQPVPAVASKPDAPEVKPPTPEDAAVPDVKPAPPADAVVPAEPVEPVEPVEPSARLTVRARLVEADSAAHCGGAHFVVVMRYAIEAVLAGSYPGTDLYVAHSCPEMGTTACKGQPGPRVKPYRAGDVHHLELKRGKGSGAIVDKFKGSGPVRYRAQCGNLVVAP